MNDEKKKGRKISMHFKNLTWRPGPLFSHPAVVSTEQRILESVMRPPAIKTTQQGYVLELVADAPYCLDHEETYALDPDGSLFDAWRSDEANPDDGDEPSLCHERLTIPDGAKEAVARLARRLSSCLLLRWSGASFSIQVERYIPPGFPDCGIDPEQLLQEIEEVLSKPPD